MPFIGLIHDYLQPESAIEASFGPVMMVVFSGSAMGANKPRGRGVVLGILRFMSLAFGAKLRGDGKRHPLFAPSGEPVVTPRVLSAEERRSLDRD